MEDEPKNKSTVQEDKTIVTLKENALLKERLFDAKFK